MQQIAVRSLQSWSSSRTAEGGRTINGGKDMFFRGSVLSEEEISKVHNESIRILEEIGVRVPSEKALTMLEKGGAEINWDNQVAYIDEAMVKDAIGKAPKEILLGGRNPKFDVHMGPNGSVCGSGENAFAGPFINMDGCGSHVIDFHTGERRLARVQDLMDAGKIFDAVPECQMLWSCIMPEDLPAGAAGVASSAYSMLASGKHVLDEVQNIHELPYIIELCKAFVGDERAVKERKVYGGCYCTVAPLSHDAEMLEGTLEITKKYQAPVLIFPMPATGSTGPASLYSNVAMANAEALSSLVIYQLNSPGTPLIFGAALGKMNVRTGYFSEGAVETSLQMTAMNEMGKYYGFPTTVAGCLSDANYLGEQATMEKVFTTLPLLQGKCDIVQGAGLIEGSMTMSLEQILVDVEIFRQCRRMAAGIDICDAKDYFDDIKNVGPGGDFLKCKTTRKAFRTDEFYNPELVPWQAHDRWEAEGSKDMYALAHDKAEQILKAEPMSPVDSNTEKVVKEIIAEACAKL